MNGKRSFFKKLGTEAPECDDLLFSDIKKHPDLYLVLKPSTRKWVKRVVTHKARKEDKKEIVRAIKEWGI